MAIKIIAYVGVTPVVGAFASYLPRRPFLVSMDLARAAVAIRAIALSATGAGGQIKCRSRDLTDQTLFG
jgi:hypothetical protein